MLNRRLLCTGFALCMFSFVVSPPAHAGRVEAVEGKVYTLTKQHGPWMIMVASFHTSGTDAERAQGKSPEEAANELVFELRQRGLPAYVYAIETGGDTVATRDRAGRPVQRSVRRGRSIGVLAGNYPGIDDDTAQQSLRWAKRYDPECLKEGVVFQATRQRPTPLAAAFLTINPKLTPEEVAQRRVDPLLVRLNSGERFSLFENQGTYTLVVARFSGKSVAQGLGTFGRPTDGSNWDNDLDAAAEDARRLTAALRREENVESHVWHDRYESIVTAGSFSSPQDPRIAALQQRFGAVADTDQLLLARDFRGAEEVKILAVDEDGNKIPYISGRGFTTAGAYQIWAFVPSPYIMRVPRVQVQLKVRKII